MECFKLYQIHMAKIDIIVSFQQEWLFFCLSGKPIKLVMVINAIAAFLYFNVLEREIFVMKCNKWCFI